MSQTREGAVKATDTIRERYGVDHWKRIGSIEGKLGKTGGFGQGEKGRELARRAGAIGGRISKRRKNDDAN